MHSEKKHETVKSLLAQGYEFCKRLPDNAPAQDLIFTDRAPTYLWRGDEAVAVYHDGIVERYKPVYNPLPPHRTDTLDFN